MKKLIFTSLHCTIEKDDYKNGQSLEGGRDYFEKINVKCELNNDDILAALNRADCQLDANSLNDFNISFENGHYRFDYSYLIDSDNCKASKDEIKLWKKRKKDLWANMITFYAYLVDLSESTVCEVEKATNLKIEIY